MTAKGAYREDCARCFELREANSKLGAELFKAQRSQLRASLTVWVMRLAVATPCVVLVGWTYTLMWSIAHPRPSICQDSVVVVTWETKQQTCENGGTLVVDSIVSGYHSEAIVRCVCSMPASPLPKPQ